jgi:S1-C subfamily serine protease
MYRTIETKISRLLLIFLLITLLGFSYSMTEDEANTIKIVKESSNSVVYIINVRNGRVKGTGTGFVWDNRGHIVTNAHVIAGGNQFVITCPDQKHLFVKLIGVETVKDIAVLRIIDTKSKLVPLSSGSSKDLLVGQKVIAIGNPYGFDHSVTTGIVSALGREMKGYGNVTIKNMIQTDASINPGNSGGPLLNSDGELIGMNTMIFSSTGSYAGIGFAVPVDTIKKIVPQLIKYGKVIRPGLGGVEFWPDANAQHYGIEGVVVAYVTPGSESDKAGIKGIARDGWGRRYLRDIIIGLNGQKITNYDDLYLALEDYKIGDLVILQLYRNDRKRKVKIRLTSTN